MRALRYLIAAGGIALGVVAYRVQLDNLGELTTRARAGAIVVVAWSFLLAGLVAWSRRPANRLGLLLTAAGLMLLLRQFRYSEDDLVRLQRIVELTEAGLNLAGVKRVLELEAENARLRRELEQARQEAREGVEATHRAYRRDLVPLRQSVEVFGSPGRPRTG